VAHPGPVKVTTAGAVTLTGAVPADALGLRVAVDSELRQGGQPIGVAYAGALVRPTADPPRDGWQRIHAVGPLALTAEVKADALTVEPRELVYRTPPTRRFVAALRDVSLYAQEASVNTNTPALATLAAGGEAVVLEQAGALARVRVYGPIEVEGWALGKHFTEEPDPGASAQLLKPSHEVLAGAELYAGPADRRPLGRLRGGALVEASGRQGARLKVTTVGEVNASGYVDEATLRPLSADPDPSL
jgi:hypothetical protein